jgi:hypothetical protein
MKLLRFLCLFTAILFTSILNGQTGYKPGYIITLSNDTLKGEIYFYSSQKNHKNCQFRANANEESREYAPGEINGYRFNDGKYYVSKRVPVEKDTLLLFIEFIMKGEASFYYLTLNNTSHYYIEIRDVFTELTEPEEIKIISKTMAISKPKYYGKLRYLLSDCPQLGGEIDNTKLNHESLIKLGEDYHKMTCSSGECIVFERKIKSSSFTFGPLVGYSISVLNFGNQIWDKSVSGYFAGLTANLSNIVSSDERISFGFDCYLQYNKTADLSTFSNDVSSEEVDYNGKSIYINNDYEDDLGTFIRTKSLSADINLLTLKIPLFVTANFGARKLRYSIGLGPVCSFTLSQNNNFNYSRFSDRYGNSIPNLLYGGIARTTINFRINKGMAVNAGVSYDTMFNAGDVDEFTRLRFKSLSFRAGLIF